MHVPIPGTSLSSQCRVLLGHLDADFCPQKEKTSDDFGCFLIIFG